MHLGGEKKFFSAVNGFEEQIFHWDGFSQGSDTRCAKHTSTQGKKLYLKQIYIKL